MDAVIAREPTLRFPLAAPNPGEVREIAPGVGWMRLPLPFALDHINVWALRDGDGLTLVDTGLATTETRAVWETLLGGPFAGVPVRQIVCTHHHPDHMALAGWLSRRTGAPLRVTMGEWEIARRLSQLDEQAFGALAGAAYRRAGMDQALARAFAARRAASAAVMGVLPEGADLIDVERPLVAAGTEWRVVVGRGHAPELAALYAPALGLLISGDQVLPGISPNVSVPMHTPDADPLTQFLESLARFRSLPEETFVLPSHKLPFYGLHRRIDAITAHHEERLAVAHAVCAVPVTAAAVLAALFPRTLDVHQTFFALGETLAHLNCLISRRAVVREGHEGDADLYRAVT